MVIIWIFHPVLSVRFEPGEEKEVQLTEMGGRKRVFGLNDLTRARAAEDNEKGLHGKGSIKGILIRRDTNERKNFR